ncbi:MAG: hypothetical protein QG650_463 [Patescibacteria group bacterium]|nr:hypothetical protein [Patescibacteria group bacterium]
MSPEVAIVISALSLVLFAYGAFWTYRKVSFRRSLETVFFRVMLPRKDSDLDEKKETVRDFKEWTGIMEQFLASLRSLSEGGLREKVFGADGISFEYLAQDGEIFFYVAVPKKARVLIEKQITGFYPDAVVEEVPEPNVFRSRKVAAGAEMVLREHSFLPIRTHQKLESDPINTITGVLGKLAEDESAVIQVLVRPIADDWQRKAFQKADHIASHHHGFLAGIFSSLFSIFFVSHDEKDASHQKDDPSESKELVREKAKKTAFETVVRIVVTARDSVLAKAELDNIVAAFSQFSGPSYNGFEAHKAHDADKFFRSYIFRYFPRKWFGQKQILSIEEVASLFHFPHSKYDTSPEIRWQNFKIVKSPVNIPTEGTLIGYNNYRGVQREIRIKTEDRFRHFYVIGQTGTGKSSVIQVLARQDISQGNGICVMDPHGDLAADLLPFVPRDRADDVIYFDPADLSRPMGLNLLEASTPDEKQMVAQDAMNMMIKLFGNEIFGPRIQDYFRNGVLTLMDYPGGSALTDIVRLFTDDDFQKERRRTLKDPIVKAWWDFTYAKMGDREKAEIIPYFQAKFGGFITNSMMRNIIGQTKSSFDVYDVMQKKKILFVNLSKGVLGDFNSKLLGMIMVSKVQVSAMRRQSIDKADRQDFFLYVDEFQNYVTDSIESILSEARKYRLGLIVAHQYLGQLHKSDALTKSDVNLKDAIFGNVGTLLSYKVGPEDAEFLAKQFAPNFSDRDLINMDKFKGVMKLMVDGQPTPAFSVTPVNPYLEQGNKKLASAYRELSRLKYGREREFVEKEIIYRIGAV